MVCFVVFGCLDGDFGGPGGCSTNNRSSGKPLLRLPRRKPPTPPPGPPKPPKTTKQTIQADHSLPTLRQELLLYWGSVTSLAFRQFFNFFVFLIFGHFGTWIAEFSPQNLSPGRKFHAESDFRVKTKKFWRPGAKNEEKPKIKFF